MLFNQLPLKISKLHLIILLLLGFSCIYGIPSSIGGLYFFSHQEIKDKRTGLALSPMGDPLVLKHGFNLEFNLIVRNENSVFGYICRVVANDSTSIDILSSQYNGNDAFWFVCGNDKKQLILLNDIPHFKNGKWLHVKLSYYPLKKEFNLSLNGINRKLILSENAPSYDKFEVFFGVNEHPRFFTSDAAPIILSDIEISNLSDKKLYKWKLREHGLNYVYDEISHMKARVSNPLWQIDSHVHWQFIDSLKVPDKPMIAFNILKSEMYVVSQYSMYIVHLGVKDGIDSVIYHSGKPYHTQANQLIYNKYTNELWSFDFDNGSISKYNFKTNSWSLTPGETKEPNLWHHNSFISPVDSSLICFGGYGHYTYYSDIMKFKAGTSKWQQIPLNHQIEPRYLAAGALHGNDILLFGGFGNLTGEQQLSPHSFYDLYSISLPGLKVTKKWSMNMLEGMVQSRSLVVDENGKDIYTLAYSGKRFNTWIHLYKLNIEKEGMLQVADSIPYKFSDTGSFSDLFFVPDGKYFVAVTLNRTLQNKYRVNVFRLNYPALPLHEILQSETSQGSFLSKDTILIIGFIIIMGFNIFIATIWFKRRRRLQLLSSLPGQSNEDNGSENEENYLDNPKFSKLIIKKQVIPSSISLIGGFQAINREGKDITALFTPTVKNLLLLILLNTYKNNKGISSMMLEEILWFDKSEISARNNRNVNINKLHALLEEFDGFDVNNDNSYWCSYIQQPFVCDYNVLMDFAQRIKDKSVNFGQEELELILSMASQGLLLPDIQTEWVDSFKSEYSTVAIDALLALAKQANDSQNYKLLLQVADTILVQDQIDEDALVYKCKSLTLLGKKSAAVTFYNNFCKNYKIILNDDFRRSFNEIMDS